MKYTNYLEETPQISPEKTQLFTALLASAIDDLLSGILIFTAQKELVYANDSARQTLSRIHFNGSTVEAIPKEILHICQALIQSRRLFPDQYWSIRSEVLLDPLVALDIQARWLNVASENESFLLLSIKDSQQSAQKIVIEEAQKYGLTLREKEIWLLHRANQTYKQIAVQLGITTNTVKKHLASIRVKQKVLTESC
jgi:hypothetical protein